MMFCYMNTQSNDCRSIITNCQFPAVVASLLGKHTFESVSSLQQVNFVA